MIRTICVYLYLLVSVIFVSVIGFPANIIFSFFLKKVKSRINYRIGQIWSILLIKITGCKMTVTGRENIPSEGGLCLVCNHGSIFDIAVLLANTGRSLAFIAKKELMYVPLINIWISLIGGLYIDRKNFRKGLKTINKGVDRIKNGSVMVVFPEGHRSRGQGLLPFRSGALKLATQAQAPIVPIAITGTYEVFEKNYRVCPGPVSVTICKPIPTAGLPKEERKQILNEQVYQIISDALKA